MSEDDTAPETAEDGSDLDAPALAAEVQALREQVLRYAAEAETFRYGVGLGLAYYFDW